MGWTGQHCRLSIWMVKTNTIQVMGRRAEYDKSHSLSKLGTSLALWAAWAPWAPWAPVSSLSRQAVDNQCGRFSDHVPLKTRFNKTSSCLIGGHHHYFHYLHSNAYYVCTEAEGWCQDMLGYGQLKEAEWQKDFLIFHSSQLEGNRSPFFTQPPW